MIDKLSDERQFTSVGTNPLSSKTLSRNYKRNRFRKHWKHLNQKSEQSLIMSKMVINQVAHANSYYCKEHMLACSVWLRLLFK